MRQIDPLAIVTPGLDYKTKALVMASGRSWWQARYRDGKTLSEWETNTVRHILPGPIGGSSSRWEEVPKKGLIALRLVCPNGNAGVVESPNSEYRFFQLKSGSFDLVNGGTKFCEAHIIGMVLQDNDSCVCWAWETKERRLVKFQDHISNMIYRHVGKLSLAVQGIRL